MSNDIPLSNKLHKSGDTPVLSFTVEISEGNPLLLANITAITCTLTDDESDTDIRNQQDVTNTNNGTMDATSGLFTLNLQPADTAMVNSSRDFEVRSIAIRFQYLVGSDIFVGTFYDTFRVVRTNY